MLADQFSCSFRLLMHGASFFRGSMEGNQAERNVKNGNWLQKLIYRISDNKFNSFSLFSLQSLLHHISLPARGAGTSWEHHPSSGGRKEHKNYQRFSLLLFSYELYTRLIIHRGECLRNSCSCRLVHIIDDRNCSYVKGNSSFYFPFAFYSMISFACCSNGNKTVMERGALGRTE